MTDVRLEALAAKWAAAVEAAHAFARAYAEDDASEEAIEDLIEPAGWVLVLVVLDALDGADERNAERSAVRTAVAAALEHCEDELVRGVGEAVLRALGSPHASNGNVTSIAKTVWPADAIRPSPRRLSRLLRGELDGFAAAHVAGWLHAHPEECELVRAMVRIESEQPPSIELAAASGGHMRDPSEGEVVGTKQAVDDKTAIDLEAVLFRKPSPRQIAIYAAEPIAVRFEADGVTTDEIAPGYWIGTLDRTVRTTIEGKVHAGSQVEPWTIEF